MILIIKLFVFFSFLILTNSVPARDITFKEYLTIFDYPEIKNNMRPIESAEFGKISFRNEVVTYPENILKLYIIASEITDEREIEKFMNTFNGLKTMADEKIKTLNLNDYNRAEFLLHFLHDKMFLHIQTGEISSYNIGIRETLDSGIFNCYKSALIYNAILGSYGYKSGYISVPNHIYSTVDIDGISIDVETTNRYGFDPQDKGGPRFSRKFHAKNVQLIKHQYTQKNPLDNFEVMTHVYVNRSNIYSKQISYIGVEIEKNFARGAALSIIGNYINFKNDKQIIENMLYKIFLLTQSNLINNPETIDYEQKRYLKILNHPLFIDYSAAHLYNLEVALSKAITDIRENKILKHGDRDMNVLLNVFKNEMNMAGKYIEKNSKIKYGLWNNSIVEYNRILENNLPFNDLQNIINYGRYIMNLLSQNFLLENNFIEKYTRMYKYNIAANIYNLGVGPINRREHEKADKIYTDGINYLKSELNLRDEHFMLKIIEIYNYNKKFLNP